MAADGDGQQDPPVAQGPPLFLNPDDVAAQQFAPPTFVKRDGTRVGPSATASAAGAPPQPAAYGQSQPAQSGYEVAGGIPGGPVFVKPEHEHVALDEARPWRWWVGPLAVFIAFAAVLFMGIGLAVVVAAAGGNTESAFDDNTHYLGLAQDLLWVAVVLLVPFMAVRYLRPEQLGLVRQPFWRSVGVLAACLVLFYAMAGAYAALMDLDENSNTLLQDTGFGDSLGRDVLFALLFTVAAPVAEELLFRGLLFRSLRDGFMSRVGRRGAIALGALLSGVIFGGIHVGGGQDKFLPVLMALGVLLALAYQWSGTLYVPVALHSINNAIATGANSEPSADWIYGLIAVGPLLALGTLWLLTRFIRNVFPQDPPESADPPPLPLGYQPSGQAANL